MRRNRDNSMKRKTIALCLIAIAAVIAAMAMEKAIARNTAPSSAAPLGMADFTGAIPPQWPLCKPFVDDNGEAVKGFLVVEAVKDHPGIVGSGVKPGDICLSWSTRSPEVPQNLCDAWLDFLSRGRNDEYLCWFAREDSGNIDILSCHAPELSECEASLGTFGLTLVPKAFDEDRFGKIRDSALAFRSGAPVPAGEHCGAGAMAGDVGEAWGELEVAQYIKDLRPLLSDEKLADDVWEGGSLTTRESSAKCNVVYSDNPRTFFSYRVELYSYDGGAHGSCRVLVGTVDLKTWRRLSVSDVIPDEKRDEALSRVIEAVVEKIGGEDNLQGKVTLTENFFVGADGLHFVFDEYAVSAYSFGNVEVVIPAYGKVPLGEIGNGRQVNP